MHHLQHTGESGCRGDRSGTCDVAESLESIELAECYQEHLHSQPVTRLPMALTDYLSSLADDRYGDYDGATMHIDTISMTGKIEDLHYKRLRYQQNFLRSLDLVHKVKGGKFRFMSDLSHRDTEDFMRAYFKEVLHCDLILNEAGKNGYDRSYGIYSGVYKKACGFVAFVAFGGNRDSYQFYINGHGCSVLADKFVFLYRTAQFFNMGITRVDIAQDFFDGANNIGFAKRTYLNGGFKKKTQGGRQPTAKYIDDMGSGEGKTLYIGKLAMSGREMCIYEKGKQANSEKHPNWVRWELRLGKKNRTIPLNIIINFQSYFVAELPILKTICKGLDLVTHVVSSMTAKKELIQADMAHLIKWASTMYGKLFFVMREATGKTPDEIFNLLAVEGVPRRLII